MLRSSATLGREVLETQHPAAVVILRTLFDALNPAAVAEREHAVRGTEQLIMRRPHYCSLGNVVTTG